jgi:hypothetical protein
MEAPITAAGMWSKEFSPQGRDAQSIAFFSAPGIERLYSGVTKSSASTAAIDALSARAWETPTRVGGQDGYYRVPG